MPALESLLRFDRHYAEELAQSVIGNEFQIDQLIGFSPQYAVIHRHRPV